MFYVVVSTLMLVFPALSIGIEAAVAHAAFSFALVGKWFVFWAVGWRLFLAGLRQVAQPAYTARVIFGFKSEESLLLVRELGFANLALGTVGVLSLLVPPWQLAAALAGALFYGMAGVNHALQPHRNRLETVAMVSDLFASVVLLSVCASAAFSS